MILRLIILDLDFAQDTTSPCLVTLWWPCQFACTLCAGKVAQVRHHDSKAVNAPLSIADGPIEFLPIQPPVELPQDRFMPKLHTVAALESFRKDLSVLACLAPYNRLFPIV
jgi:hypothetical protein